MAVRILKDEEQGYSCLYCSTTMLAFGGIFYKEEDAEKFLEWLGDDIDARQLTQRELDDKIHEWRKSIGSRQEE